CTSSKPTLGGGKMNRPVSLISVAVVSVVLGLYCTPAGVAQSKSAGEKTTVTGCLQKGHEADEFSITGEDGKTYGLRSSAVDLSKHLGHKVTVTGTLKAESYERKRESVRRTRRKRQLKLVTSA